jgi:putative oxygen-independent coproporphyrinogen III oxidase
LATARVNNPEAFGVYVHWPFCASKCPYCDFNSHVRSGGVDEGRFLRATLAELAYWGRRTPNQTVGSVFFGGGTPSLMSPTTVGAILDAIAQQWDCSGNIEITLEANPSSVEANRFLGYRTAGVNRVSLGIQSLCDAELRALGRLHTAADARAAIAVAAQTFDRYSFDLICARPRQTLHAWRNELTRALALAGRHLSLYQLTIEPETPFAQLAKRGKLTIPDAELAHAFYEVTQDLTERAGLPAYEISNHAAPGEESRHNLLYWRYGTYIGVGAGAHGRLMIDGNRCATSTERQPERWVERVETCGVGVTETTPLSTAEQADEALLMGLRLTEGLNLSRLAALSGARPSPRAIHQLIDLGMLAWCGDHHLRATRQGRFVLNELVLQLASALEPATVS